MSISPLQRAALLAQSRPPGPPALWAAVGTSLRALGRSIDAFGVGLQGDTATIDKRAHLACCSSRAATHILAVSLLLEDAAHNIIIEPRKG